jgi:hypothetical protein
MGQISCAPCGIAGKQCYSQIDSYRCVRCTQNHETCHWVLPQEDAFLAPPDPFDIPPADPALFRLLHNQLQRKLIRSQTKERAAAWEAFEEAWAGGLDKMAAEIERLTETVMKIPVSALLEVIQNPQSFSLPNRRARRSKGPGSRTRSRSIQEGPSPKRSKTKHGSRSHGNKNQSAEGNAIEEDGAWEDIEDMMQVDNV